MKFLLYITLIILPLFACEKKESLITDELPGTFLNPEYTDSTISFSRGSELPDNEYAIQFNDNGSLIEIKNIGWCGTPPITYGNFEGFWTRQEKLIEYTVDFWGGTMDIKWEIIVLDAHNLIVKEIHHHTHMTQ